MALKFKKKFAHKSNYGGTRSTKDIDYIVVHYTGNSKDTALNNCKYFQGASRGASAHYFVDGGKYVYKSVAVNRVAWAVGGCYSTVGAAGNYYKKCTNANSLSVEMCNSVGKVPANVQEQTIELVKFLMKKYGVPASRVIRHWDVNGKVCPEPWAGATNSCWSNFKKAIGGSTSKPAASKKVYGKVATKKDPLRMRNKASLTGKTICNIPKGAKVEVLSKGESWHKVKYSGKTGYCSAKYITLL